MDSKTPEIEFLIAGLSEWKTSFLQKLYKKADQYILVLERKDANDQRLTMMIGKYEAMQLALAIEKLPTSRPTLPQLYHSTILAVGFAPTKVVLDRLTDDGIFMATIYLTNGKEIKTIDSRPADAFTLAVNAGCNIFVNEDVLKRKNRT